MRLDELQPSLMRNIKQAVHQHSEPSGRMKRSPHGFLITPIKEIISQLENLGFKYKAEGAFSEVYTSQDGKYIAKINKYQDAGYEKFLNHIYENRGNPHYPRITKPMRFTGMTDRRDKYNGFVVISEKLDPLENAFKDDDDLHLFHAMNGVIYSKANGMETSMALSMREVNVYPIEAVKEMYARHKGYFREAQKLRKTLGANDWYDLHEENVMVRPGTDQLVIIDALAEPG